MIYHRTVNSLLTVCLTHRDNPSCYANLAAGSDGIGDEHGGDWYLVQSWLANPVPPAVLKRSPRPNGKA